MSPSARKVWIEMLLCEGYYTNQMSPSARKVWIEMLLIQAHE